MKGTGAEVSLHRLISLRDHVAARALPGHASNPSGGLSGPRRGQGGDLFDLRPWQDGDDPRGIDAAATARTGRPQMRRRHEEIERSVLLVADFRRPMLWGTRGRFRSVAAADALALEGWRSVMAGARVGAIVFGDGEPLMLPPRLREPAMLQIAAMLVSSHASALSANHPDHDSLSMMLDSLTARVAPGSAVLLATGLDDPGAGFGAAAATLMRKSSLELLLVQDSVETAPPSGSFMARTGLRIERGTFGATRSAKVLDDHAIPYRIVRAEASIDDLAA
ncbi:DUF58 domain-containing protein [Paracoccus sp. TK19116]|uniref:DUF58 domain-containing protein n=1 Tax=Paracoccus albicereus TaxID=2922394 RepID=A0ABT1MRQ3_9RHOB|nr:DUF58 domain-containing protein [Paracoccus albicereus]MCQ0970206.1 DUF58 domain-containing protein [Paracoccus albicereus]